MSTPHPDQDLPLREIRIPDAAYGAAKDAVEDYPLAEADEMDVARAALHAGGALVLAAAFRDFADELELVRQRRPTADGEYLRSPGLTVAIELARVRADELDGEAN